MSEPNTHPGTNAPPPPPKATPTQHHNFTPAGYPGSSPQVPTHKLAKRRRPWFLIITSILLLLIAGGLTAVNIHLYRTTQAWQERSVALEDRTQDLANSLATVEEDLHATQEVLDRTETQLDTARDRITELADEKAQLGDEKAVQQRLVEYQEHVSEITAEVLSVLDECITGQTTVMEYLATPENYDEDDLARVQDEVKKYCTNATRIAEGLKEELAQ